MNTLDQIKHAIKQLPARDQNAIFEWLERLTHARQASFGIEEPLPAYTPVLPFMTLDEYMEFEERSSSRHEYINGVAHAMSGPSLAHIRITQKLLIATHAHLSGGSCEAFATDAKLQILSDTEEIVYYPDLIVACNPDEWGDNYVTNPKLVVEVLSASTRHIDRREKALTYRRVRSIEEYALIEQDEYRVSIHRRADQWQPHVYNGPGAIAEFRSIALSLPLSQIYAGTPPDAGSSPASS